jgi:MoaA/NifB/PqqE/SkfB family radical SAM enzyme
MGRSLLRSWLANVIAWRLDRGRTQVPLVYGLFVTYRCNFACAYCDDGSERKFPDRKARELPTEDMKRVLDRIRAETGFVAFAGGEPLLRRDLVDLLEYAREIGFRRIAMNTNGLGIETKPRIPELVDDLMVSLDATDEAYCDRLYGVARGTTARVQRSIRHLADRQAQRKFRLIVNSVILPDNIHHIYDVMAFCLELGAWFSPAPCLVGPYPHPGLPDNPAYRHLLDAILDLKRAGMRVLESDTYLLAVRDFADYRCLPLLYLRIDPEGNLVFPCLMLAKKKVPVLEHETLADAVSRAANGTRLDRLVCDNRCHISCYLEPSRLVTHPSAVLREAASRVPWPRPDRQGLLRRLRGWRDRAPANGS